MENGNEKPLKVTWAQMLPLEISSVDEIIEPFEEVSKQDIVLEQEPSDIIKKIYSLCKLLEHECGQTTSDYNLRGTEELHAKVHELTWKAKTMDLILVIAIKEEYNLWASHNICSIKKDWKVVETPPMLINPFPFYKFNIGE